MCLLLTLIFLSLSLFVISGDWPKLVYDFANLFVTCAHIRLTKNLICYFHSLRPSFLHFGSLTVKIIKKYSVYYKQVKIVFKNFEYS